jgi:hypothetical protein
MVKRSMKLNVVVAHHHVQAKYVAVMAVVVIVVPVLPELLVQPVNVLPVVAHHHVLARYVVVMAVVAVVVIVVQVKLANQVNVLLVAVVVLQDKLFHVLCQMVALEPKYVGEPVPEQIQNAVAE